MAFEHYIHSGGKRLRCGFTTGTCAALAASGAARALLTGTWPESVSLVTPKGLRVEVPLEECRLEPGRAVCGVRKDGGDDIDQTSGALIVATVTLRDWPGVRIEGGPGVGRVTKPGLDQPVGEAAINRVPRQMIRDAVSAVWDTAESGLTVTISVPEGAEIAKKTFNPNLGIEGGISILGTSGIVEPMSTQALVDTIRLELGQAKAQGCRELILTPGNYGMDYLNRQGLMTAGVPVVKCSNFIGDALDEIALLGFERVLLVGHVGKLVKLAGGIMNTHSRVADCRTELFCAHAALCGGSTAVCRELMDCATTDACIPVLRRSGLERPVFDSLLGAIQAHLTRRAAGRYQIGAVLFSNAWGELGRTDTAKEILEQWRNR